LLLRGLFIVDLVAAKSNLRMPQRRNPFPIPREILRSIAANVGMETEARKGDSRSGVSEAAEVGAPDDVIRSAATIARSAERIP
jgi:hypothetical protein